MHPVGLTLPISRPVNTYGGNQVLRNTARLYGSAALGLLASLWICSYFSCFRQSSIVQAAPRLRLPFANPKSKRFDNVIRIPIRLSISL